MVSGRLLLFCFRLLSFFPELKLNLVHGAEFSVGPKAFRASDDTGLKQGRGRKRFVPPSERRRKREFETSEGKPTCTCTREEVWVRSRQRCNPATSRGVAMRS